jgi:hypothetical protein
MILSCHGTAPLHSHFIKNICDIEVRRDAPFISGYVNKKLKNQQRPGFIRLRQNALRLAAWMNGKVNRTEVR